MPRGSSCISLAILSVALLAPAADAIASVPHTVTGTAPKALSTYHTIRSALHPARQLRTSAPESVQSRGGLRGGASVGSLWARYEDLLDEEPLKTRIWSGFFIGVLGDIICQFATRSGDAFVIDVKRCLIFALWGAFGFTPLAFKWYGGMESALSQDIKFRFLLKTALDQTVFSTGITTLTFMCITVVEGLLAPLEWKMNALPRITSQSVLPLTTLVDHGWTKVTRNLWETLLENWKVWPAVQLLNFSVVPVKFQVLFVNLVAIWWNFVLSMFQHK